MPSITLPLSNYLCHHCGWGAHCLHVYVHESTCIGNNGFGKAEELDEFGYSSSGKRRVDMGNPRTLTATALDVLLPRRNLFANIVRDLTNDERLLLLPGHVVVCR